MWDLQICVSCSFALVLPEEQHKLITETRADVAKIMAGEKEVRVAILAATWQQYNAAP